MEINTIEKNGKAIAIISSTYILITNVESALNFIATVRYETGN